MNARFNMFGFSSLDCTVSFYRLLIHPRYGSLSKNSHSVAQKHGTETDRSFTTNRVAEEKLEKIHVYFASKQTQNPDFFKILDFFMALKNARH